MKEIVNKHAPIVTKQIKVVKSAPWFNVEYASLRKQRRKAEKKFRKSGRQTDKDEYINLRKQAIAVALENKKSFISKKLENGSSSKTLYAVVRELTDDKAEVILPSSKSDKELADHFLAYFKEKIVKIRATFTEPTVNNDYVNVLQDNELMNEFEPTTNDEVREIVSTYGIKCSPEDPVPVVLLQTHIDIFVPIWTEFGQMVKEKLKNRQLLSLFCRNN